MRYSEYTYWVLNKFPFSNVLVYSVKNKKETVKNPGRFSSELSNLIELLRSTFKLFEKKIIQ